jgi:multimeric flavodoxin WrbA
MSPAREAAVDLLTGKGYEVAAFDLDELEIADCTGCFGCWTSTPGQCIIPDDGAQVAAQFTTADVAVLLNPLVFGGYSYHLKKALDRSISLSLPYLKRMGGETHHPRRYAIEQRLVVIGLLPRRDEEAQQVFGELVRRNSLNLQPVGWSTALVFANERPELSHIAVKEAFLKAGVVL